MATDHQHQHDHSHSHAPGHGHGHDHSHAADAGPVPQMPNAPVESTKALGLTFLALVFGVLFVVVVLSLYYKTEVDQRRARNEEGWQTIAQEALRARDAAEANLSSAPRLLDPATGKVAMPIAHATDAVLAEYAGLGSGAR